MEILAIIDTENACVAIRCQNEAKWPKRDPTNLPRQCGAAVRWNILSLGVDFASICNWLTSVVCGIGVREC